MGLYFSPKGHVKYVHKKQHQALCPTRSAYRPWGSIPSIVWTRCDGPHHPESQNLKGGKRESSSSNSFLPTLQVQSWLSRTQDTVSKRKKKGERQPHSTREHRLRTQHPLARLTDKDGQYRDWQRCEKMSTSSASASEHKVRDTLENSLGDFKSFI